MGLSGFAFVQVEGKLKLVETNYFLRWARTSICPKSTARSKRCLALSSPYPLLAISPIDQGPPCPKVNQARQSPSSWIQEQARLCHLPYCYASGWSQTTCPQGCPYV